MTSSRHQRNAPGNPEGNSLVCQKPKSPPADAPRPQVATMATSERDHQASGRARTMTSSQTPSLQAAADPRDSLKSSALQKSWTRASRSHGAKSHIP